MKSISIPFRTSKRVRIEEGQEVELFSTETFEELKLLRKRGQGIIQSSLDIEEWIKESLSKILFKHESENSEFLKGIFLDSDFCMFGSKIKILNQTLSHFKVLSGKDRAKLENLLPKVNKYRNAFAHGKIFNNEQNFYISYFEGNILTKELHETYWNDLSTIFNETFELLQKLESKLKT